MSQPWQQYGNYSNIDLAINKHYNPEPQVIEGKYINARALMELLQMVYGKSDKGENNFTVKVSKSLPILKALRLQLQRLTYLGR
jgi:hypothetical protein